MDLWTYHKKPTKIAEIIGNSEIRKVFIHYLTRGNLPNIILRGEHGTAKRTLARLVAIEYLGKYFKDACIEIDGAIYRGKDVISSGHNTCSSGKPGLPSKPNVMEFSTYRILLPPKRHKIIIIYNFDNMTVEAQNALRTIMEKYAITTRFILICNYTGDIIEAIQSRCVQLKTSGLKYNESKELIDKLLGNNINKKIKHIIIMLADGDYKKLINYAQVINSGGKKTQMTLEEFYNLFNIPPIKTIKQILLDIIKGVDVYETIKTYLVDQGHGYCDIIDILSKILVFHEMDIPEDIKYRWLHVIAEKYREISPYTHEVHIYSLFANLYIA